MSLIGKRIQADLERPSTTVKDKDGKPEMVKSTVEVTVDDCILGPVATNFGLIACHVYMCYDDKNDIHMISPKEIKRII